MYFRYKIRNITRSKSIKITIKNNGEILITKPKWVSDKKAIGFFKTKRDWVRKHLQVKSNNSLFAKYGKKDYLESREVARTLVLEKVKKINKIYNFKFNKIYIKNQSTKWGSCSNKGNLNFNFRIIYLPEELQDYLIVHELCHLGELNHSQKYWSLVSKTIPDYKEKRARLMKC